MILQIDLFGDFFLLCVLPLAFNDFLKITGSSHQLTTEKCIMGNADQLPLIKTPLHLLSFLPLHHLDSLVSETHLLCFDLRELDCISLKLRAAVKTSAAPPDSTLPAHSSLI